LLSAVGAGVSWGETAAGQDRFLPVLPEGKGVELVRQRCGLCHGLELVAQQRLDRGGWARVMDQMSEFGVALSPDDRRDILDYLAAFLGPDRREGK
jgi:mono/diheme cytochrome c family protein